MAHRSNSRWLPARLASALLLCAIAVDASTVDAGAPEVIVDAPFDVDADVTAGDTLYLEVSLNGRETHRIAHFSHDGGRFLVGTDTLLELGFRLPAAQAPVDLVSLAGVSWHYDAERQHIDINAPAELLGQARTELNAPVAAVPQTRSSPGALLNYDLYATRTDEDASSLSAFAELRAFGHLGVFSSSWLTRLDDSPGVRPAGDSQRLDTSWTRSFVDSATVLRVGDAITGSLSWTRATRFAGLQLRRDFSLQPELVTFPVPAFLGQAALPSTVDLYVNGLRQYSNETPAGPFQLNTMPIVNGSGDAQVVVTDVLGRQSTYNFAFYTSNQLLRAGLSDWSLDLGFVRDDYGTRSFSYADKPSVSGVWRRGTTDWLTVEAHAEASEGLANAGTGGVVQLGGAGTLSASFARSDWRGRSGEQAALGYSWRNRWLNLAVDSTRSSGEYRDIASLEGTSPAQRSDRALVGLTSRSFGSFGANYVQLAYPDQPRSRYASAFWFRSLGPRLALSASINQNLDQDRDRSAFVSLSMSLANTTSATLTAQHDAHGTQSALDLNRSIPSEGGYGWRARIQDGEQAGGQAELGWRGDRAQGVAGLQNLGSATLGYAGINGAFVLMDSHFYVARRIDDAFAVVATGVPDVPVLLSNRPIGRTNADGNLLVTPLNAFQRNLLAIDPMRLSADVHIDNVQSDVVPADRSGVLVDFRVQPAHAASLVLHDEEGQVLPVGSVVDDIGNGASAVIGYDGTVYLEGLAAENTLRVRTPAGSCTVRFTYRATSDSVPLIGPLRCRNEQ
jgi:outer membrane usher protein